jgi:S-adenosylmethionine:diacylglycerol 3-amino-3-carboxypropyl transferase
VVRRSLNGPKTVAFWRNITGDLDAVTVDVWAARAATGDRSRDRVTAKQYQTIAAAYRAAADIVGANPRDVQAAVWVHTRNQWRADGRYRQS